MKDFARGSAVGVPGKRLIRWRPIAIYAVFLLSGLSALLYQVTWQRALMLIYGSNTESVAMVVSSFLVGLGLGNLAGGKLSVRQGSRPLILFLLAELFIGAYGIASPAVFRWAGNVTLNAGPIITAIAVFVLLLVPTLCMGATLPLLVAHETRRSQQVGAAVSHLYFVNTLGAGFGAFLSGFVLLGEFGLAGTVRMAASLNALSVVILLFCTKRNTPR
jgi:predicted membrane-bound spermidine synthase